MLFVYATDLHGDIKKYNAALALTKEMGAPILHLGADLLPKNAGLLKEQKKFVKGFLQDFHAEAKDAGVMVLAFFGNDDVYTRKPYYREYAPLLDETPYQMGTYLFTAYGFVPDYPFGLKTACKLDHEGWWLKEDFSRPIDVGSEGFIPIGDKAEYLKAKGTIENDLKSFDGGSKNIMAIHAPPQALGMDVCADGRRVGSLSVTKWIEQAQPLVCLCGHIHESYKMSGQWKGNIGRTLVIQPGQLPEKTTMVLIEIINDEVKPTIVQI